MASASVEFLRSARTKEDFERFWKDDPVGAAQYAGGLGVGAGREFHGLKQLREALSGPNGPDLARLQAFLSDCPNLFEVVETAEKTVQKSRDESLGWTTS